MTAAPLALSAIAAPSSLLARSISLRRRVERSSVTSLTSWPADLCEPSERKSSEVILSDIGAFYPLGLIASSK